MSAERKLNILTSCAPSSNPPNGPRKAAESERMEASDRIGELSASKRVSQRHQAQAGGRHQRYARRPRRAAQRGAQRRGARQEGRHGHARSASPTRSASSRARAARREGPARQMENALKELQARLDAAEGGAAQGRQARAGQAGVAAVRDLEGELDAEQRRHQETQKNARKSERRLKELSFASEEERKNQAKLQELVEKLQSKVKAYKRQVEEAEEIAAINLAKFRKVQHDLEESEERAEVAEQSLTKFRSKSRTSVSVTRVPSAAPAG
uniref:Paramyosin n=1 Tax=Macrostomum lignano TaxID=282301 RepID=A0A1I8HVR0_9PLAT